MPQSRKETLVRFAQFMQSNAETDPQQWLALKGIGPWTVSYAQLRGQSQPDCFLDKDLVVKKRCSATHHSIRTPQPLGEATRRFTYGINHEHSLYRDAEPTRCGHYPI